MIVIVSDLHITDESTARNVKPEAFSEILKHYVLDRAVDWASESGGGTDKVKIKELNIILLGDIFDLVRNNYWLKLDKDKRPWNGVIDKATGMNSLTDELKTHYEEVLDLIFKNLSGKALIDTLNEIKKEIRAIDPGINVTITYIVGNHDRALNCFDSLKDKIKNAFSEYTGDEVIFDKIFFSTDYSVLCRHGHEYDDLNYGYKLYLNMNNKNKSSVNQYADEVYKVQSIGEVITAELMSGIIFRLKQAGVDDDFIDALKDINNVRPLSDVMRWLYWYGKDIEDDNKKQLLMKALTDSLQAVVDSSLAKKWDDLQKAILVFNMDITDEFKLLLGVIKGMSFDNAAGLVAIYKFFDKIFGSNSDDFEKNAEIILESGDDIQYMLMGHTHEAKHIYFDGTPDDMIKMYINTGTFLPFAEKTKNEKGFVSANQMTIAAIFRKDEDTGGVEGGLNKYPTLELWDGVKRKRYS